MDDKTYQPTDEERYASRYEYSNLSSKDVEADPNYIDYGVEEGEYPIGDSQDIDQTGLVGDYYAEDEYYVDYRAPVGYVPPQRTTKGLPVDQSKYPPAYGSRGSALPARTTAHYVNEVGDYRRSALLREKLNYIKGDTGSYPPQYPPEYTLSRIKRDALLRSLTEKDYRIKVQQVIREERLKQDRVIGPPNNYYEQSPVSQTLTHEQLEEKFKKNYKMDTRVVPPPSSKTQSSTAQMRIQRLSRQNLSPKSDTQAIREHYYAARRRFYEGQGEKVLKNNETKDTRSEPVQPDLALEKSPKRRLHKEHSNRRSSTADDYAREMLETQKQRKDLELKYKNDDFGKTVQEDTELGMMPTTQGSFTVVDKLNPQSSLTTISQFKGDTSEEKLRPPRKNVSKIRASVRSTRSKNTSRSRKYDDMVKLQKSKCTIMSVIYDGIQKCEQAKYEVMPQYKGMKNENFRSRASKQSQTSDEGLPSSSTEVINSEIINNMFKEFRDYHLQNISQEVKRIQYLDVLPKRMSYQGQ